MKATTAISRVVLFCLPMLAGLFAMQPAMQPAQAVGQEPDQPSDNGQVYWGAYIQGAPFDMSIVGQFESKVGKGMSIIHWGQPWKMNGQFLPFWPREYNYVREHGSIPMINWNSWHLGDGVNQPDFQLRDIYEGKHDSHIRSWARGARDWGHPFFLRFNHEMNGDWYPWSETTNGNAAGDYVKAWRHVHNLFQQEGATNVSWVWCVNIIQGLPTSISSLYPGDAYVDWVAIDGYNAGPDQDYVWIKFWEIFLPTYQALQSLAPAKPVMLAEFASAEYTGSSSPGPSKAGWIADALEGQIPAKFPNVKAVVWFNWNDNDPRKTWPVESSQASQQAFGAAIRRSVYASNQFRCLNSKPLPLGAQLERPELGFDLQAAFRLFLPFQKRGRSTSSGC